MTEFIKLINSKLPNGITYGSLSNNEKATIKGMFLVCNRTQDFEYPIANGFPTINDRTRGRIVREAMIDIKDFIVDIACEYILSLKEKKNDVSSNK